MILKTRKQANTFFFLYQERLRVSPIPSNAKDQDKRIHDPANPTSHNGV